MPLAESGLLPLVLLTSAAQRGAVCNDGSAPGYYYKPGRPGARWLLYMQGGFWCWDLAAGGSCEQRWKTAPHFFSTDDLPRTIDLGGNCSTPQGGPHDSDLDSLCGGVFSSDAQANPDFHDAHRVYLACAAAPQTHHRADRGAARLSSAAEAV